MRSVKSSISPVTIYDNLSNIHCKLISPFYFTLCQVTNFVPPPYYIDHNIFHIICLVTICSSVFISGTSGILPLKFLPICYFHPKRSVSRILQDFSFCGFQLCILGYFTCLTCYLSVLSVIESMILLFGIAGTCTPKGQYMHPKRTVNFHFIFLQPCFRFGIAT